MTIDAWFLTTVEPNRKNIAQFKYNKLKMELQINKILFYTKELHFRSSPITRSVSPDCVLLGRFGM